MEAFDLVESPETPQEPFESLNTRCHVISDIDSIKELPNEYLGLEPILESGYNLESAQLSGELQLIGHTEEFKESRTVQELVRSEGLQRTQESNIKAPYLNGNHLPNTQPADNSITDTPISNGYLKEELNTSNPKLTSITESKTMENSKSAVKAQHPYMNGGVNGSTGSDPVDYHNASNGRKIDLNGSSNGYKVDLNIADRPKGNTVDAHQWDIDQRKVIDYKVRQLV